MQAVGFIAIFILFIISASLFTKLQKPGTPINFSSLYTFSRHSGVNSVPTRPPFSLLQKYIPLPSERQPQVLGGLWQTWRSIMPTVIYNYVYEWNQVLDRILVDFID